MNYPELLSPAGSIEGVRAAVQSGATAIYMGFGTFNARRGAKNFTHEQMVQAIEYCKIRGVKTNIAFNILATDRERKNAIEDAKFLQQAGADALIVQDLGLVRLLRHHLPQMELHASTQMTVHTLEGALFAKELGFSRVVLSRECSLEQIKKITAECGIETEVFIHGALCMCYSGQCYLSGVIGQRSGNRGMCAQPCRLQYEYVGGKSSYALSLKDLSLSDYLVELTNAGVSSLKIEGRMKRPEYAAVVTKVFADLLKEQRKPTKAEKELLQKVFSRDGFTDGYLTGKKGDAMFGTKTEISLEQVKDIYNEAASRFAEGKEAQLVPITMTLCAVEGSPLELYVSDGAHSAFAQGSSPERAIKRASSEQDIEKQLRKTGGTPFCVEKIQISLQDGLMVPSSMLNAIRREALADLINQRAQFEERAFVAQSLQKGVDVKNAFDGFTVEVRKFSQISQHLLSQDIKEIYIPLVELYENISKTEKLTQKIKVCAMLPKVFDDSQTNEIENMLKEVRECGVTTAVAGNVGHIPLILRCDMEVYGDYGLNAFNSETLAILKDSDVVKQTMSTELMFAQIRDIIKPIKTEVIVYGYLTLMVFENCIIRRKTDKCSCEKEVCKLKDRMGKEFVILPEYGCRNTMLNSQPLYIAEKSAYERLGVTHARLKFTTENADRVAFVVKSIINDIPLEFEEGSTKGLYFRGVN